MENLNSCDFLEGLSCYQPFEHITCHLTTFRRPNWPIVSASAERVFSLLTNAFGSQQESALQDYLEASVMLRYNNAKRV